MKSNTSTHKSHQKNELQPSFFSPTKSTIREYSISYGANASSSSDIDQICDYLPITPDKITNRTPSSNTKSVSSESLKLQRQYIAIFENKTNENTFVKPSSKKNMDFEEKTSQTSNKKRSEEGINYDKCQELIKNSPLNKKFMNIDDFLGKELGKFPQISANEQENRKKPLKNEVLSSQKQTIYNKESSPIKQITCEDIINNISGNSPKIEKTGNKLENQDEKNEIPEEKIMKTSPSQKKDLDFNTLTPKTYEKKNREQYNLISPENKDKISLDFLFQNHNNLNVNHKKPASYQNASSSFFINKEENPRKSVKKSNEIQNTETAKSPQNITRLENLKPQIMINSIKSNRNSDLLTNSSKKPGKTDELKVKAYEIFEKKNSNSRISGMKTTGDNQLKEIDETGKKEENQIKDSHSPKMKKSEDLGRKIFSSDKKNDLKNKVFEISNTSPKEIFKISSEKEKNIAVMVENEILIKNGKEISLLTNKSLIKQNSTLIIDNSAEEKTNSSEEKRNSSEEKRNSLEGKDQSLEGKDHSSRGKGSISLKENSSIGKDNSSDIGKKIDISTFTTEKKKNNEESVRKSIPFDTESSPSNYESEESGGQIAEKNETEQKKEKNFSFSTKINKKQIEDEEELKRKKNIEEQKKSEDFKRKNLKKTIKKTEDTLNEKKIISESNAKEENITKKNYSENIEISLKNIGKNEDFTKKNKNNNEISMKNQKDFLKNNEISLKNNESFLENKENPLKNKDILKNAENIALNESEFPLKNSENPLKKKKLMKKSLKTEEEEKKQESPRKNTENQENSLLKTSSIMKKSRIDNSSIEKKEKQQQPANKQMKKSIHNPEIEESNEIQEKSEENLMKPVIITEKKVSFTENTEESQQKMKIERNLPIKHSIIKEKYRNKPINYENTTKKKVCFFNTKKSLSMDGNSEKNNENSEKIDECADKKNNSKKSEKNLKNTKKNNSEENSDKKDNYTIYLNGCKTTKNQDLVQIPDKNFPKSSTNSSTNSLSRKKGTNETNFLNLNEFVSTLARGFSNFYVISIKVKFYQSVTVARHPTISSSICNFFRKSIKTPNQPPFLEKKATQTLSRTSNLKKQSLCLIFLKEQINIHHQIA